MSQETHMNGLAGAVTAVKSLFSHQAEQQTQAACLTSSTVRAFCCSLTHLKGMKLTTKDTSLKLAHPFVCNSAWMLGHLTETDMNGLAGARTVVCCYLQHVKHSAKPSSLETGARSVLQLSESAKDAWSGPRLTPMCAT